LIVKLLPVAEAQLHALPVPAARRVLGALRVLAGVPHSGRRFSESAPRYAGMMWKIVRIRRNWNYRVVYEILHDRIDVHVIIPTWVDLKTIV